MLSNTIERKFTNVFDVSEWEILTDTGYESLIDIKQTIEYEIYRLVLSNDLSLECADTHIVFNENYNEVFVKDLKENDLIHTSNGLVAVKSVINTHTFEHMYDVGVDSKTHRYYTNDILSHNTASASAYILWYAMFNDDVSVLVTAHKYNGALEIMDRIRYGYESCPDFIRAGVVDYNKRTIKFDNGSRIMSETTTMTTGRGKSLQLLYADELSYVGNNIADGMWVSIMPTLSNGGRAIITSTPNTDEDKFATIWKESQITYDEYGNDLKGGCGINGFFGYRAEWYEHPNRDEAWKLKQIGEIGEEKFRREYNLEFLTFEETLINSLKLSEMVGKEPIRKSKNEVRWFKNPIRGNTYLVALDPSLGTGGNYSAIEVWELPTMIQIAEWRHNATLIQGQIKVLRDILFEIQDYIGVENSSHIYYSTENNTVGESALIVIQDIGEDAFPGMFLTEVARKGHVKKFRKGFNTTYGNKISTCSRLKYLLEEDKMTLNSRALISELKVYVSHGFSYKAKIGYTDDLVSAVLLIVRMAVIVSTWDVSVFNSLSVTDNDDSDWEPPMPFYMISNNNSYY